MRGAGVHQPALDIAVAKLNSGAWVCHQTALALTNLRRICQVHVFPEGKVNQESCKPDGQLLRFKWGV